MLPVVQPTLLGSPATLPMLFLAAVDTILTPATFVNFAQPTITTRSLAATVPTRLLAPQGSSFLAMSAMDAPPSILIG